MAWKIVMVRIVLQFVIKWRACCGNSLKTFGVEEGILVLQMSNFLPSMCLNVFEYSSLLVALFFFFLLLNFMIEICHAV